MTRPILIAIAAVLVIILLVSSLKGEPDVLFYGEVDAKEYLVASKSVGRIESIHVRKGDRVDKGQPIFKLASPELDAKLAQAKAALEAATAASTDLKKGARLPEIAIAQDTLRQAQVAQKLAQATFNRVNNLYNEGVVSRQRRDEAQAAYNNTLIATQSAEQALMLVKQGARDDTIQVATANQKVAQAVVTEAQVFTNETLIKAPHAGEVTSILLREGEISVPALPVVRLIDLDDAWGVFNVREDHLNGLDHGDQLVVTIPALNLEGIKFRVTHIAALGHYATWRTSKPGTGYDMRTFEVEAVAIEPVAKLRAGMSLLVTSVESVNE